MARNHPGAAAYARRRMARWTQTQPRLVPALGLVLATMLGGGTGCVDADDRSIRWPALHATIVGPSCATAGCHGTGGAAGGIDLQDPEVAYAQLTGRVCGAPALPGEPPGNYVWPGDPGRSRLLSLLRADQAPLMPPDRPLATPEIDLLEAWILSGAPCD